MNKGLISIVVILGLIHPVCFSKTWEINSQNELDQTWPKLKNNDQLRVRAARYLGPWNITKSINIHADSGAILDAQKRGHGIQISATNVLVSGLTIENWGEDIGKLHSGIFVDKESESVELNSLILKGGGFGIWIDAAKNARIKNCKLQGDLSIRSQDRGNGIHLFNVTGAQVENNEVWHTRDGIYIDTSNHNVLKGNHLHDLRYGIHYMYSHSNTLKENLTERTRTGYALMQSHHLTVQDNISREDLNYGILMNYITYSTFKNNKVSQIQQGRNPNTNMHQGEKIAGADGKSLFIYNSLFNEFDGNVFSNSDLGVHITAGSEGNKIVNNSFVNNRNQVKYISNRPQEWSVDGKGNYWSDYLGWDMNDDGLGDTVYKPNDQIDNLLWKYPKARTLFNSPGLILLRWIESQFPVLKPLGVTDSYPLIQMPNREAINSTLLPSS